MFHKTLCESRSGSHSSAYRQNFGSIGIRLSGIYLLESVGIRSESIGIRLISFAVISHLEFKSETKNYFVCGNISGWMRWKDITGFWNSDTYNFFFSIMIIMIMICINFVVSIMTAFNYWHWYVILYITLYILYII